jgi:site-specific recombinase XerD
MLAEIDRFVNWVRRRSPQAHTWQDYRCDLRFFLEEVGDHPPRAVTFLDVDRFILSQSEKGFKPATINRRLASIAALYAFLMPEDDDLVCPVYIHAATTCASRSACQDPCRKKVCASSSLSWTIPATWLCSR